MNTEIRIDFKISQENYKEYMKLTDKYLKELDTLGEKIDVSMTMTEVPMECV